VTKLIGRLLVARGTFSVNVVVFWMPAYQIKWDINC